MDRRGKLVMLTVWVSGDERLVCANVQTLHGTIEQCPPRDAQLLMCGGIDGVNWNRAVHMVLESIRTWNATSSLSRTWRSHAFGVTLGLAMG